MQPQDPHSTANVDVADETSRHRWAAALGVTEEALESAVLAVGPRIDKIKDFLAAGMADRQQDA